MKNLLIIFTLALWTTAVAAEEKIQVYFSPHGGCTEAVVSEVDRAKSDVYVQAYSYTSAPIAKSLVDAQRPGVKVAVILDKSQRTEKYSEADFLLHAGITTYSDARHAIAHNKIIVDGQKVLTGSFNFTKAAEDNNAENLLVIDDPQLARKYMENCKLHHAHSDPYLGYLMRDDPSRSRRRG
jgi:phosphatidylserine/phosphatidylglycerophosphate/cardiolipin synthase-like enzyme